MTLEQFMKANGYTDNKFADQIGVSRVAVTLYNKMVSAYQDRQSWSALSM